MQNFYNSLLSYIFLLPALGIHLAGIAQEAKVFTTQDFDLHGKVKSCLVLTDYGREVFEFNTDGFLTKSVTRYNDKDYNITYYKYKNGNLLERRDEVYRDGQFDQNSSIAHFYSLDTLKGKKITEQIVTYRKEFLDRYEYHFDEADKLSRILRSGTEGFDETRVEYSEYKGEATISHFLNEVLLNTERTSTRKGKNGLEERVVLTKDFINGSPDKALEQVYDSKGNLVGEVEFEYDASEKSFVPARQTTYDYGEKDMISAVKTTIDGKSTVKSYVFQFDVKGNWIKQIITPENAYTTRRIDYYPEETGSNSGK